MVPLPLRKRPFGCKWVYRIKYKPDGFVERYIARLVAKGLLNKKVDFLDTFSPVENVTTTRTVLTFAACKKWHLHQLDINNAFLHTDLHEEVFI